MELRNIHYPLAIACFVVSFGAGTARAELVPEDPYTDLDPPKPIAKPIAKPADKPIAKPVDKPVATPDAISAATWFASAITKPEAEAKVETKIEPKVAAKVESKVETKTDAAKTVAQPASVSSPQTAEPESEFWVEHGWKVIPPAIVLLAILWIVRRRRVAARRRKLLEERRTQFGMSAVDPAIAEQFRAAWEQAPAAPPTAVVSMIMRPSDRQLRMAAGTPPPPIAEAQAQLAPYLHPREDEIPYGSQYATPPSQYEWTTPPGQHAPYVAASPSAYTTRYDATASQAYADAIQAVQRIAAPPRELTPPPAPYPLTFPAFPERPSIPTEDAPRTPGVWEASSGTEIDEDGPTTFRPPAEDYAVTFARGSQPDDQLGKVARMVNLPAAPRVRAAQLPPRPRVAITIRSHGGKTN